MPKLPQNPLRALLQPESASVFDSPIVRGLRTAAALFGVNAPDQGLLSVGGMTPIPKIKGFTTAGGRVIDLTPTVVRRTVGKNTVEEAPQRIARLLEGDEAIAALKRLQTPSTLERIRKYSAEVVRGPAELPDVKPKILRPQPSEPKSSIGKWNKGRTGTRVKLNPSMVRIIREKMKSHQDLDAVAHEYGVSAKTIDDILRGSSWGWVK